MFVSEFHQTTGLIGDQCVLYISPVTENYSTQVIKGEGS